MNSSLKDRMRVPAWLTDDYLASYVTWREECGQVREAYDYWTSAERPQRPSAYAAYHAALDREERAAQMFQLYVERVRRWL